MRVRIALMLGMVAVAGVASGARFPPDAPYCATPGTRPVFVAPMGEPFRGEPGQPYPAARWFAVADADRDGTVDPSEFVADARRFFRTIDRDHDGRLTPEEVGGYERDVAPEIALWSATRIRPGDGRPERRGGGLAEIGSQLGVTSGGGPSADYGGAMGAGRYAWLNVPEPVASTDLDVNRIVAEDEFLAAATRRFATLDALQRGGPHGRLRLADLPRTPAQVALEGPCRPRPRPKRGRVEVDRPDGDQSDGDTPDSGTPGGGTPGGGTPGSGGHPR